MKLTKEQKNHLYFKLVPATIIVAFGMIACFAGVVASLLFFFSMVYELVDMYSLSMLYISKIILLCCGVFCIIYGREYGNRILRLELDSISSNYGDFDN